MTEQTSLDILPLLSDDDLHAWLHIGSGNRLVVSFSGIGLNDAAVPGLEFARTAAKDGAGHALFIADPNRTWLNGLGLIEKIVALIQETARQVGATEVVTLGHSMGGYSAAVIAAFTPVRVAVCLSPQASVHPEVAEDDPRWMIWRSKIANHRIISVRDHISPDTRYFAFFGQHGREAPQRSRFPVAGNIQTLIFPKTVHNTPQRLKALGLLESTIWFAFNNRPRLIRHRLKDALGAYPRRPDQIDTAHLGDATSA